MSSKNRKENKNISAGRKSKNEEILTDLKDFYENHSAKRLLVSMSLLFTNFKKLCREQNGVSSNPTRLAEKML